MNVRLTCVNCHEVNEARKDGRKVYCWSCGHRVDVPKGPECDCRQCKVIDLRRDQKKAQLYREAS